MAHALHNMVEDVCQAKAVSAIPLDPLATRKKGSKADEVVTSLCPELQPTPSGVDLLKYIRNVSFVSKWLFSDLLSFFLISTPQRTCPSICQPFSFVVALPKGRLSFFRIDLVHAK